MIDGVSLEMEEPDPFLARLAARERRARCRSLVVAGVLTCLNLMLFGALSREVFNLRRENSVLSLRLWAIEYQTAQPRLGGPTCEPPQ